MFDPNPSPYQKYATHVVPDLSYSYDSLAPYISKDTLEFHHQISHQSYVTNINHLIKFMNLENISREEPLETMIIKSSKVERLKPFFNNASHHWNHILFWQCMKPNGGGSIPPELETRLISDFGSVDQFKNVFFQSAITHHGSGWVWLSIKNNKLFITKTNNASNPLIDDMKPILGCDLWEHAFFLDYRNKKQDYVKAFINNLINWEFVASQLN